MRNGFSRCRKIMARNNGKNTVITYAKPLKAGDLQRYGRMLRIETDTFSVVLNGGQINSIKKILMNVGEINKVR